jgi:large subunit ribosomal protein L6
MSKIGMKPIAVPSGVQVQLNDRIVTVKGAKGELITTLPESLSISQEDSNLVVKRGSEDKKTKSLHGLFRSLVANAVEGVEKNWEKRLEIVGTGFNVKAQGEDVVLKVGFSHTVVVKKIPGISFRIEGNNKLIVVGVDKQLVGQVAYQIKIIRKPDAYKGKGIRYEGEKVRIKPGKKAKTA